MATVDFSDQEIKVGDWIVQVTADSTLKYAIVTGFSKGNEKVQAVSFYWGMKYHRDTRLWDSHDNWVRTGPYTLQNSDRCFVIDETRVPADMVAYVRDDLQGDPTYTPLDI